MTDHENVQQIPTPAEALSRLVDLDAEATLVASELAKSGRRLAHAEREWKLHRAEHLPKVDGKSVDIREAEVVNLDPDKYAEYLSAQTQADTWRTVGAMVRSRIDAARSVIAGVRPLTD